MNKDLIQRVGVVLSVIVLAIAAVVPAILEAAEKVYM